jgi:Arc/MetJ family transcription regulator
MRHTVFIDDGLLEQARKILGTRGVRDTIEASLREIIRRHRLEQFRHSLGNMELDLTPEELTELRRDE